MVPVYLDADGRTVYTLDARGMRVDVGEVVESAVSGCVMVTRARLPDAVVGTVRQVPCVESVADAGALFGRRAEAVRGRGGAAELLAQGGDTRSAVAVADSTPQPDGTHAATVRWPR